MSTVVILGAINMDCIAFVSRFPREGENLRTLDLKCHPGGRGANQATALANLKIAHILLGKVGYDFTGDYVLSVLKGYKINTEYIWQSQLGKTGICSIIVSKKGENTILGHPAVNRLIRPDFVSRNKFVFELGDWFVASLEYPLKTVEAALAFARKQGLKTVLDPSPLIDIPGKDFWASIDYVLPNQYEIRKITGENELLQGAIVLKNWGVKEVIIKQGALGASFLQQDNLINSPAFTVKTVVDTTGAGDLFNAAFIYGMIQTESVPKSVQIANLVASYAVQKKGTGQSYPLRKEIDWEQLNKRQDTALF